MDVNFVVTNGSNRKHASERESTVNRCAVNRDEPFGRPYSGVIVGHYATVMCSTSPVDVNFVVGG